MQVPPILTAREREIVPLLLAGATRAEIARDLKISQETVKSHSKNIFAKFDVSNLREGFQRISDYQTYFGIGGLGVSRFVTETTSRLTVLEGRVDGRLEQLHKYLIVGDAYTGHRLNFSEYVDPETLEIEGASLVSKSVIQEKLVAQVVPLSGQVPTGGEFELGIKVEYRRRFGENNGGYRTNITVPTARRRFEISFPEGDIPQIVSGQYWFGNSILEDRIEFQREGKSRVFYLETSDVKVNVHLQVNWEWGS